MSRKTVEKLTHKWKEWFEQTGRTTVTPEMEQKARKYFEQRAELMEKRMKDPKYGKVDMPPKEREKIIETNLGVPIKLVVRRESMVREIEE